MKDVAYFVACSIDYFIVVPQEAEVETTRWISYSVVLSRITHGNKKIL